jgi:hypothetical protein
MTGYRVPWTYRAYEAKDCFKYEYFLADRCEDIQSEFYKICSDSPNIRARDENGLSFCELFQSGDSSVLSYKSLNEEIDHLISDLDVSYLGFNSKFEAISAIVDKQGDEARSNFWSDILLGTKSWVPSMEGEFDRLGPLSRYRLGSQMFSLPDIFTENFWLFKTPEFLSCRQNEQNCKPYMALLFRQFQDFSFGRNAFSLDETFPEYSTSISNGYRKLLKCSNVYEVVSDEKHISLDLSKATLLGETKFDRFYEFSFNDKKYSIHLMYLGPSNRFYTQFDQNSSPTEPVVSQYR